MARVRASRSSVPASSRAECMESVGMPTSMVAIPSLVAVSGPMVEAARHRIVRNELLGTDACPAADAPPQGRAAAVGGVALVALTLSSGPELSSGWLAGSCRLG